MKKDIFEIKIEEYIINIEQSQKDYPDLKDYLEGQKSGYKYSLMIYRNIKSFKLSGSK